MDKLKGRFDHIKDGLDKENLLPTLRLLRERAAENGREFDLAEIDHALGMATPEAYVFALVSMRWRAVAAARMRDLAIIDDGLGIHTYTSSVDGYFRSRHR